MSEADAKAAQVNRQIAAKNEILFEMLGVQDILRVYADRLSITPKGLLGLVNKGIKGTKEIHYHSISAIQIKDAGLLNGYLQFTFSGGSENKRGITAAVRDENTFMFCGKQMNAVAHQVKGFIQWEIDKLHERSQHNASSVESVSQELTRLADLFSKGLLSGEEFTALKKRLIG